MDHVAFERVLSVTSEDKVHCASSLLDVRNAGLKWLSSPDHQSGKMEAELALQQPSCIKSVSMRNFGTAFIELLVGAGGDGPYLTLLPSKMLMTPAESKKGLNRTGLIVITQEKLSRKAVEESWDRVLIRCRQPFQRDEQFGLSSLILSTDPNGPSNTIPSSSKATTNLKRSVPKINSGDYPLSLPPMKKLETGKELDSPPGRLLSPHHQSPAMQRLMAEQKERQLQQSVPTHPRPNQRRRFLTKEVPPSSCTASYMASYRKIPTQDKSLDFTRLKRIIAVGEEKGVGRRGRGWRSRPRDTQLGGCLTTRAVDKCTVTVDKEEVCSDTEVMGSGAGEEKRIAAQEEAGITCIDLTEEDIECPLCWFSFPESIIEIHSELCSEDLERFTEEREKERGSGGEGYQDVVVLD